MIIYNIWINRQLNNNRQTVKQIITRFIKFWFNTQIYIYNQCSTILVWWNINSSNIKCTIEGLNMILFSIFMFIMHDHRCDTVIA